MIQRADNYFRLFFCMDILNFMLIYAIIKYIFFERIFIYDYT